MNICVVGWYYNYGFMWRLGALATRFPVFIIGHKPIPASPHDLESHGCGKEYPNVGLEFGAYDQYLQNHWDETSDVLFIHDDTTIHDARAFRDIEELHDRDIHQAFIFNNEWEEIGNKGKHGRAIWCSAPFLTKLKADGGFPYDRHNTGQLAGPNVNDGIEAFTRYVNEQEGAGYIAIIPGLQFGRRGILPDRPYLYHRKTREGAQLIPGGNGALVIGAGNMGC